MKNVFLFTMLVSALLAVGLTADPAWGQSIQTDGNIETDAQLVSKVTTGTAPLAVLSTTVVPNLNADQVDGVEGAALALDTDLQNVETMLVALQSQVNSLGLALVPRTGQTTCYDAAGAVVTCGTDIGLAQDGDLQLGVTWPNPRFTKNGDGTVTDNLTGLIWLEDANCFGAQDWASALASANTLQDSGTPETTDDCGLSDGSMSSQWRLPDVRELHSLVHYGVSSPAVPNTAGTEKWVEGDPFSDVVPGFYYSSTTRFNSFASAWVVAMDSGNKTISISAWPVRGGQ